MNTDTENENETATPDNAYALLEPIARRPIRALLRQVDNGQHNEGPEQEALWRVVYGDAAVTYAQAVAIEAELVESPRTIRELLDGWRPAALSSPPTP